MTVLLQPIFLFTGGCAATVAPRRYYLIALLLVLVLCGWVSALPPSLPLSEGLVRLFITGKQSCANQRTRDVASGWNTAPERQHTHLPIQGCTPRERERPTGDKFTATRGGAGSGAIIPYWVCLTVRMTRVSSQHTPLAVMFYPLFGSPLGAWLAMCLPVSFPCSPGLAEVRGGW